MAIAKASIHFRAALGKSEAHNLREEKLDYVHEDMIKNNSHWSKSTIAEMEKEIKRYCKEKSGRKLQKNSEPIREAVVNLHSHHTIDDLKELSERLKTDFGIECFQIHIHRDEGRKNDYGFVEINHHAHMLFRWQDMETGKTMRLNRLHLSQIQDLVADTLDMQRGELRVNSNRNRLESVEYKRQQERLRLEQLQQQTAELEQKKNEVRARIEELKASGTATDDEDGENASNRRKEALWAIFEDVREEIDPDNPKWSEFTPEDVAWAIERAQIAISGLESSS